MTRESKLGLLIGGALILLVCILVSDLVATTANKAPAQLVHSIADDALRKIQEATNPTAMALDEPDRRLTLRQTPVYNEGDWPPNAAPSSAAPSSAGPSSAGPSSAGPPSASPPNAGHSNAARSTVFSNNTLPAIGADPAATLPPQHAPSPRPGSSTNRAAVNRLLDIGQPAPDSLDGLAGFNDGPLVVAASQHRRVEAPAPARGTGKTVTVNKGQTLSAIAQQHLGSSKRWRELLAANKDLLKGDPRRLQAGMTLTIPALPPTRSGAGPSPTRQPVPAPGSVPTPGSLPAPGRAAPPGPAPTRAVVLVRTPNVVILQSGETLADVARREMGSAGRWSVLYNANRSVIGDNPDIVQPGTRLVIPAE